MIMSAKEKAIELYNEMLEWVPGADLHKERDIKSITAIQCALICVKEVTTELNKLPSKDLSDLQYWSEVEHEINLIK